MRAPVRSGRISDLHTGAEVHLQFFVAIDFHPPKGEFSLGAQHLNKSINRPVLAVKPVVS